ncbi:unnamed protein product [Brassica rapa subsp. trilocularis]
MICDDLSYTHEGVTGSVQDNQVLWVHLKLSDTALSLFFHIPSLFFSNTSCNH